MTYRTQSRMPEIDALRGIAALSVVLYHYTSRYDTIFGHATDPLFTLSWGHYGVNLFFMISGFVIFMSLDRTRTPLDFVVSRVSRLFPTYWAAIVITTLGVGLFGLLGREVTAGSTVANFGMLHNLFGVPHVDGVYWTLEVEMLFYCWALLAYSFGLLHRVHYLIASLFILRLAYFIAARYFQLELPVLPFRLLILQYIPWFAAGMMIYRLALNSRPSRADAIILATSLGLTIAVEGYRMGAVMAGCGIILYAAALGRTPLNHRWMIWLGAVSYPWYLIHQNIGYIAIQRGEALQLSANASIVVAFGLSLALAYALTVLIDRPAMAFLRQLYRNKTARLSHQANDRGNINPGARAANDDVEMVNNVK